MSRWRTLDERRGISEEEPPIQNTLTQIIREDLRSLYFSHGSLDVDKELENFNEIENESGDEELRRLMAECDKILDDEQRLSDMLDDLDHVICPICQKNTLHTENFVVSCECGVYVNTNLNTLQIKDNIVECVELHNNACGSDPHFTIVNEGEGNHIYLLCYVCSNFVMLL